MGWGIICGYRVTDGKKKRKKCPICKEYFEYSLDGRAKYYTRKYCTQDCAYEAIKQQGVKTREKQKEASKKRKKELDGATGKITKKCKHCKQPYEVYASQYKARGSSFCSRDCKSDYARKNRTVSQLKKALWTIFSKYIRLRDAIATTGDPFKVKCITCGAEKQTVEVDAGHFYSRRFTEIMFDEHNVHAQCKKCNMPPGNGEQYLYSLKIIEMYGQEELDRLTKARYKSKKFGRPELRDMIEDYEMKFNDLKSEYWSPWMKDQK